MEVIKFFMTPEELESVRADPAATIRDLYIRKRQSGAMIIVYALDEISLHKNSPPTTEDLERFIREGVFRVRDCDEGQIEDAITMAHNLLVLVYMKQRDGIVVARAGYIEPSIFVGDKLFRDLTPEPVQPQFEAPLNPLNPAPDRVPDSPPDSPLDPSADKSPILAPNSVANPVANSVPAEGPNSKRPLPAFLPGMIRRYEPPSCGSGKLFEDMRVWLGVVSGLEPVGETEWYGEQSVGLYGRRLSGEEEMAAFLFFCLCCADPRPPIRVSDDGVNGGKKNFFLVAREPVAVEKSAKVQWLVARYRGLIERMCAEDETFARRLGERHGGFVGCRKPEHVFGVVRAEIDRIVARHREKYSCEPFADTLSVAVTDGLTLFFEGIGAPLLLQST